MIIILKCFLVTYLATAFMVMLAMVCPVLEDAEEDEEFHSLFLAERIAIVLMCLLLTGLLWPWWAYTCYKGR